MKLTPVDYDPFAQPEEPSAGVKLTPVDYDPFAQPETESPAPESPRGLRRRSGRLATAGSEFVKGAVGVPTGVAKGFGIMESKQNINTLKIMDAIDAGEVSGDFHEIKDKLGFTANDYDSSKITQYASGKRAPIYGLISKFTGNDEDVRAELRREVSEKAGIPTELEIKEKADEIQKVWPEVPREMLEASVSRPGPQNNQLYQLGQSIDDWLNKTLHSDPEYRKEIISGKVPHALGSAVGFVATTLLGRSIGGNVGGLSTTAVAGSASNASSQFLEAVESGATLEQAFEAADIGALVGTSEVIPISRILDRVDKGTGGLMKRTIVNMIKGGTEEAIQEGFQTIMNNLTASTFVEYDPERGILAGAGENAGVGFTAGALVSALVTLIGGRRAGKNLPTVSPDKATDAITGDELGDGAEKQVFEQGQAQQEEQGEISTDEIELEQQMAALDQAEDTTAVPELTPEQQAFIAQDRREDPARAAEGDRRQDLAERKRVADMTPAERERALMVDEQTGVGTRRAYQEAKDYAADDQPVPEGAQGVFRVGGDEFQVLAGGQEISVDQDSLKFINDNMSPTSGDKALQLIGDALKQTFNPTDPVAGLAEAQKLLDGATLKVRKPDGEIIELVGVRITHGEPGRTKIEADASLKAAKRAKESAGERAATGQQPPNVTRRRDTAGADPGGERDNQRGPAQQIGDDGKPGLKNYVSPKLKRENYRAHIKELTDSLVKGGGIALVGGDFADINQNVSRDKEMTARRLPSVNPEWFQRMNADPETSMPVDKVKRAVDKALNGERLGMREARVVETILGEIEGRRADPDLIAYRKKELQNARQLRQLAAEGVPPTVLERIPPEFYENAGEVYQEAEYLPEMTGQARSLFELAQMAEEAGYGDKVDAILDKNMPDREAARALFELIGDQNEGRTQQQARARADQEEPAGRPEAGATQTRETTEPIKQPSQSTEAPAPAGVSVSATDEKGATREKQQKAQPQEEAAGETETAESVLDEDLFGQKPVKEQQLADAQRAIDERLQGREDVPIESGEGDLFSGKSKQVDIDDIANQAATSPENEIREPTDAQREAGNYKKGHVRINGLDISIENPAGSRRRPEWPKLKHHYGYIKRTEGRDGDHIDVFLGPSADNPDLPVFVIDQVNPDTRRFDEHKVMLGFADGQAARVGYLANYSKNWTGLGNITEMSLGDFKEWLKGDTTQRVSGRNLRYTPDHGNASQIRESDASAAAQLDLFAAPELSAEQKAGAAQADYRVEYKQVGTSTIRSGLGSVQTPEDAARVLAPLRKHGQETFIAMVLDENGKILNIIRHTKGLTDQASVQPHILVGAIIETEGAKQVIFAHNHPSGDPIPSSADRKIQTKLTRFLQDTGIDVRGHVVLGEGRRAFWFNDNYDQYEEILVRALPRKKTVELTERVLRKSRSPDLMQARSPEEAKRLIKEIGQNGIVLLDNKHRYIGFLPLSQEEFTKVRGGVQVRALQAMSRTNAIAAIAVSDMERTATPYNELQNITRFLGSLEISVLDHFANGESLAQLGLMETSGTFFSREYIGPIFFSSLKRAAENIKQEKGGAAQMLAMLKNQPGVKTEELEWTGLEEYLRAKESENLRVTKQEIVEFLEGNGVQVEEVTLGGQLKLKDNMEIRQQPDGRWNIWDKDDWVFREESATETRQEMESKAAQDDMLALPGSPKFMEYQLPGGENYREVLLTLPHVSRENVRPSKIASAPYLDEWNRLNIEIDAARKRMSDFSSDHEKYMAALDQVVDLQDQQDALHKKMVDDTIKQSGGKLDGEPFKSGHFDEPNILAHIRLNDRTDVDGNKVLFVEEMQSDWHQQARKQGYIRKESKNAYEIASKKANDFVEKMTEKYGRAFWGSLTDGERAVHDQLFDDAVRLKDAATGVPDAPFKGNAWTELAIKRVLRMAAEEGFDSVAWTTGEQQAERYDLSKQVEKISYQKTDDGKYQISAFKGGEGLPMGEFEADKLPDVVGKEVAEKIVNGQGKQVNLAANNEEPDVWNELSGVDLKVGGEGMKGFYDRTLPNLFKKVAGKLDKSAAVGETVFRGDDLRSQHYGPKTVVHSLKITNKIREGALAGQPLFSRGLVSTIRSKLTGKALGMKVADAEKVVDQFKQSFAKDRNIVFEVVDKQADILGMTPKDIRVKAVFDRGNRKVYLVASNLDGRSDAMRHLRHEVIGHDGLAGLGQQAKAEVLDKIKAAKDSAFLKGVWEKVDRDYAGMAEDVRAEEVFARLAESAEGRLHKLWNDIVRIIQKALRKLGIIDAAVTKAELLDLIYSIAEGSRMLTAHRQANPSYAFSQTKAPTLFNKNTLPVGFKAWQPSNAVLGHVSNSLLSKQGIAQRARAARRKLQDKFIVWRDVQDAIEQGGGRIADFSDAYNKFTLIEGKIGDRFRKLFDNHIKPLVDDIAMSPVTVEQLEEYLYAQFAPQRNKRIADINPNIKDGGSGMTNAEAAAILAKFTPEQTKHLERLAKRVYAMQRHKLDVLVQAGRLTPEVRDELLKDDRYVPLKGFNDASDLVTDTAAIGRGFDQAQDALKRALGRKSLAADLLSTAVRDVEAAIINAEKNKVGQSVLKLVMDNPNPNLWKVNPIKVQRYFNKRTGQVEQRVMKDYKALARDPNVFVTWVKGKPYAIEFRDTPMGESALARALKNMGVDSVPWYIRYLAAYNRWLSYVNTALSPEFLLTNPMRDIQTALAKAYGDYDARIAGQVVKNLPVAIRGAIGGIGEGFVAKKIAGWSTKWKDYYVEYQAEGGKTDYFRNKTVDEMKSELEAELLAASKGTVGASLRAFRKAYHAIENGNAILENTTRLSMYITLRENGYSRHQAAVAAKNLTVNFNRKGEAGALINSLYLFYNASLQGTHLTLRLMRNPKVQKLLVAAGAGMVLLTQYNILVGGDDDDGEPNYFRIPDYEKERNIIIMWPDGSGRYTKIPMPYGLNVPMNGAAALAHVANGRKVMEQVAWVGASAWNSFSPVGERGWNIVAPTVVDPFVDISLNRNFADRQIMPADNPFEKAPTPDSQKAFASTLPAYKRVAELLNEVTGGHEQKPGYIDISPESIEHLVDTTTGAAGGFVNRVLTWVADPEMETARKPFIRKFYGEPSPYTISQRYRDCKSHIFSLKEREEFLAEKVSLNSLDAQLMKAWVEENKPGLQLVDSLKDTEKRLKKLYEERKELQAEPEKNKELIKLQDEAIRKEQAQFNTMYNEVFLDLGIAEKFDLLSLGRRKSEADPGNTPPAP